MTRVAYVLVVTLLAWAALAAAQTPSSVHRVGFLGQTSPTEHARQLDALRQGLREAGYREGANLTVEYRWAEGQLGRLAGLARELATRQVDVIVTHGTAGVRAAKEATSVIPIVIAAAGDPVRSRLIATLARPGGNITGVSIQESEVIVKRLEFLKQIAPKASRIGYLWVPGVQVSEVAETRHKELEARAQALGMEFKPFSVPSANDLPRVLSRASADGIQALIVENTSVLTAQAAAIARFAVKEKLPTVGAPFFVEAGGLLAYGPSLEDTYRLAATYVDRILKGAKPGDLPVEQATKYELVINLKTARVLGVTLSPSVVARADRVIE